VRNHSYPVDPCGLDVSKGLEKNVKDKFKLKIEIKNLISVKNSLGLAEVAQGSLV